MNEIDARTGRIDWLMNETINEFFQVKSSHCNPSSLQVDLIALIINSLFMILFINQSKHRLVSFQFHETAIDQLLFPQLLRLYF